MNTAQPSNASQIIVVSGHFSRRYQPDKIEHFERLDQTLQRMGHRLLLVNHSLEKFDTRLLRITVPRFVVDGPRLRIGSLHHGAVPDFVEESASIAAGRDGISLADARLKVLLFHQCIVDVTRRFNPSLVIMWHEFNEYHYALRALLTTIGIPYVFVEYGVVPGTINYDGRGQMANSWIARTPNEPAVTPDALEQAERYLELYGHKDIRRKRQERNVPLSEQFETRRQRAAACVFYAGQNDYATGIQPRSLGESTVHSPFFESTEDALRSLAEIARKHDWMVLFKPHPMDQNNWSLRDFDDVVTVERDADINACLDASDTTVTIVSQVAYLALLRDRPCVLLGRTHLNGKGCAYEIEGRADLERAVIAALRHEGREERQTRWKSHLARMLSNYLVPYDELPAEVLHFSAEDEANILVQKAQGMEVERVDGPEPYPRPAPPVSPPSRSIARLYRILYILNPMLWLMEKIERVGRRLRAR